MGIDRQSLTPADIEQLVVRDLEHGLKAWFTEFARIKDKRAKIVQPRLNSMQAEVAEAVAWCLKNQLPIRLIILKPRQKGCSTISTAVMYWMANMFASEGVIIGGQLSQVKNLWEIFRRYSDKDVFNWGFPRNVQEEEAKFGNGARIQKETAKDSDAGRSGTFNFLLCTEAARWHEGGVADANAVLAGIMACVPKLPNTCVILESTAKGPTGFFPDYWNKAVSLEEAKRGKWNDSGFIKIFSPWYAHEESQMELPPSFRGRERDFIDTYSPDEQQMAREFFLTPRQIQWHRATLASECKDDPMEMSREFPKTPEEAFHASSNQKFNTVALAEMRREAFQFESHRVFATLEGDAPTEENTRRREKLRYALMPSTERQAHYILYDGAPKIGANHLIIVDPMTGEFATKKSESMDSRDKHSVLVIRQGYFDHNDIWHRHKVVARCIYRCRWDTDIAADRIFRLSRYFGDALVIVEINQDKGIVKYLRDWGANLFVRSADDSRIDSQTYDSDPEGALGFLMTGNNSRSGVRDVIIENLCRHLRERHKRGMGVDFWCLDAVREMEKFIVNSSGRAEAAPGEHDDDVLALAIGMNFIESHATRYRQPNPVPEISRELRNSERRSGPRAQFS